MASDNSIFEGGFGIERETLRVDKNGRLAQTPHPFDDPHMERDFCESQLELITPVCPSPKAALEELGRLSDKAVKTLEERGEYLWLCSNPPHYDSEDEVVVARYSGDKINKHEYRIKLLRRYGKRLMTYSGIHFNYSLSGEYIRKLNTSGEPLGEFTDRLYLKLFKYATRYSWLILLLTAASPVFDMSLREQSGVKTAFDGHGSCRSGVNGYWNAFIPRLDHSSLKAYADSVNSYIQKGVLFSAGELYLPVRIKPRGENSLESLVKNGADHIELRMFDLNPLAPEGVFAEDLEFAHYFMIYLINLPDFEFTPEMQAQAIANHKQAAGFDLDEIVINGYPARYAALGLLDDMEAYFGEYEQVMETIAFQRRKLTSGERYCNKVYDMFHNNFNREFFDYIKNR